MAKTKAEQKRWTDACLAACADEDLAYLEHVVAIGSTLRKQHEETLGVKERYQKELCEMERARDKLAADLAVLKDLLTKSIELLTL
jgi:hypothetical protein